MGLPPYIDRLALLWFDNALNQADLVPIADYSPYLSEKPEFLKVYLVDLVVSTSGG